MAYVSEKKKEQVADFVKLLKEYPIIGIINLENMPAPQLQNMRKQLKENVVIQVGKGRLMKIAIEQIKTEKKGIEELIPKIKGMPGFIFTKENPFSLAKIIKKNKSAAPAKAGQIAPKDITVNAGPTAFAPGPIISELGEVGIKASIQNGKVAVMADSTVAKEGDVISDKLASILTRLNIEPMEIGLDLVVAYENGELLDKKVLFIDEQKYLDNLALAHTEAFNLAMFISHPNTDTINLLIGKSFTDAKAIAMAQKILTDETAKDLVSEAERSATNLSSKLNLKIEEKPIKTPTEEKTTEKEETVEEAKSEPAEEESKIEEEPEESQPEPIEELEPVEEKKEEEPEPIENPKEENTEKEPGEEEKKEESDQEKAEEEDTVKEQPTEAIPEETTKEEIPEEETKAEPIKEEKEETHTKEAKEEKQAEPESVEETSVEEVKPSGEETAEEKTVEEEPEEKEKTTEKEEEEDGSEELEEAVKKEKEMKAKPAPDMDKEAMKTIQARVAGLMKGRIDKSKPTDNKNDQKPNATDIIAQGGIKKS